MAASKITISAVVSDLDSATLVAQQPAATHGRLAMQWLIRLFTAIVAGLHRARVRVNIDSSTGVAAAVTVTCVQASITAGDKFIVRVPGVGDVVFTATSGVPVAGDGTFAFLTSNTVTATSLKNAINTHPALTQYVVATSSSTLTLTAFTAGTEGNAMSVRKIVTNSGAFTGTGAFTGGIDAGALNTAGVTFTIAAALTANDTLTIGSVVLTGKASPSGESQFACGVSQAADTAALTACINAHSKLKGLYVATNGGSGVITILCYFEGRELWSTTIAKSAAQGSLSAATWAPAATDAWAASTVDYALGAP